MSDEEHHERYREAMRMRERPLRRSLTTCPTRSEINATKRVWKVILFEFPGKHDVKGLSVKLEKCPNLVCTYQAILLAL